MLRRSLPGIFALLLVGAAATAVDADAGALDAHVSVRAVGVPLPSVLAKLQPFGVELACGPEFARTKAVVVCQDQRLTLVLDSIAAVFGAEWKRSSGARRYVLRRTKAVADWLVAWKRCRAEGEAEARAAQEATIAEILRRSFAALDEPLPKDDRGQEVRPKGIVNVPLAKLVKSLPANDLRRIIHAMASIAPVRAGVLPQSVPPPVRVRFRDLDPTQQQLIRAWQNEQSGGAASPLRAQRAAALSDAVIEFGSRDATAVWVQVVHGSDRYGSPAVGGSYTAAKMDQLAHAAQYRLLSRRPTPKGALLGARPTIEGRVEPSVVIEDGAPVSGDSRRASPPSPMVGELLAGLGERFGWLVVADYHSRSARCSGVASTSTARDLLQAASSAYSVVVRQHENVLLARNQAWPDRDEEEVPAPQPDLWIAALRKGLGLTLSDRAAIDALPAPQQEGLAGFNDPLDAKVRFAPEVARIRALHWLWALYRSLSKKERDLLETADGLPIGGLTLNQRNLLTASLAAEASLNGAHIAVKTDGKSSGSALHVFIWVPGTREPLFYQ